MRCSAREQHIGSRLRTWEDTLNIAHVRDSKTAADRAFKPRWGAHCFFLGCKYWFAPLHIRTKHRPATGFIADRGPDRFFALNIPKSGSSSMAEWLHGQGAALVAYSHLHKSILGWCRNTSYDEWVARVAVRASGNPRHAAIDGQMTGCGHAASFDLEEFIGHTVGFAVVREPVARFVSALDTHHASPPTNMKELQAWANTIARLHGLSRVKVHGDVGLSNRVFTAVGLLAQRAALLRNGSFVEDAHVRTQAYYLSATDASGRPIDWGHVVRLEDSSATGELQSIAMRMLRGAVDAKRRASGFFAARRNSKEPAYKAALMEAVYAHPTLACDLCVVYAQDFRCLGYALPAACSLPACRFRNLRFRRMGVVCELL